MSVEPSEAVNDDLQFIICKLEGGDKPVQDHAGWTKYGISEEFLEGVQDEDLAKQDIRDLTFETAVGLYREHFVRPVHYKAILEISRAVAFVTLDHAIHAGPSDAIKTLQRAIDRYTGYIVSVDGIFGPQTRAGLSDVVRYRTPGARGLIDTMLWSRLKDVNQIVRQNSGMERFHTGWIARLLKVSRRAGTLDGFEAIENS